MCRCSFVAQLRQLDAELGPVPTIALSFMGAMCSTVVEVGR